MERIEVINKRLADNYGLFDDGRPNWRVVWSDDQIEKRLVHHTKDGFELLTPVIQEVKKYNYISAKYILERLIAVPDNTELADISSYEPIWTFEDKDKNPLPPDWDVIYLVIERVREMLYGRKQGEYKAPWGLGNTAEESKMRAEKLYEQLWGDESAITDALSLDSAVGYGTRKRNDWTY